MASEAAVSTEHVIVEVASDRLTASVRIRRGVKPANLTSEGVLKALEEAAVVVDDAVRKSVEEFVRQACSGASTGEPFEVVRGRAPHDGRDEEFVWDESLRNEAASWQDDAPVDFYTLNSILTVDRDVRIGAIRPLEPPRDGVDVCGQVITHHGSPQTLEWDSTLQRASDDPTQIISQVAGKVVQQGQKLTIEEILLIPQDVGFDTGNVDSCVSVHVKGRIPDRFEVKSKGSITVGMSIEAARVTGGGDIVVCHGILGRHAGLVSAEGQIIAKFASEANLVAKGDVKIGKQLMSCRVCVGRKLIAPRASVIGGCLYGGEGVEAATLGSDANVPTRIVVGVNPEVLLEVAAIAREIRRVRELLDRICKLLEPLKRGDAVLSGDQEQKVTELTSAVNQAEARIEEDEERRRQLLENTYLDDAPSVLVSGTIHQGVVIQIGDRQTVFHKVLKGPVSIEKRKIKNVTEIVTVNKLTGSVKIITNERRSLDELLDGFEPDDQADSAG